LIDSRISGFYRMSIADRIRTLEERGVISAGDAAMLQQGSGVLTAAHADNMIENVIGVFALPLGIAANFLVNQKDYIVPMVVEEPSIVAGVSSAAKLFRNHGGFSVTSTEPILIGQIQVIDIEDPDAVIRRLYTAQASLTEFANASQPTLVARGGGAREIEYFKYRLADGRWTVVLHLLVDTRDAMGANMVNSMCEHLAPRVEALCGGRVCLRILSNLADKAQITAQGTIALAALDEQGFDAAAVRDGIVLANEFANADPYRAATHNKGIMNGVDAVAVATGNDWRSTEAAAHAFAVRAGAYRALTSWTVEPNGDLRGELNMPIKVGTVGGTQSANPAAALGLRIIGASSGTELAELMGAVGLAQNFAALRALVTHGIQKGHMRLHARSLAASAGASEQIFDQVVAGMIDSGEVKPWKAHELVNTLQSSERRAAAEVAAEGASGEAAGKVILLGEHAVVYDRHALALPLESSITASIVESSGGVSLTIPAWGMRQAWTADEPAQGGAASAVRLIMNHLGVAARGFDIAVASRIPAAMGLGASAAFAVAVIRAFDSLLEKKLSNADVDNLAFECEKLAHGDPSGIDNNIATYAQPVLYSKGTRTRTRPFELLEVPPLVVASSGMRGNTKEQVAAVRARYERNTALYTTIFDEIDEMSVAGAVALKNCDYAQLGALMNVCQGFLNAIEVSTPELEKMIAIARGNGAIGAKLTGAGGGGSIVALCPGTTGEVARALKDAGYRIIRMAGS
jgi:hydroxymethylglutaryl-CoA reductase